MFRTNLFSVRLAAAAAAPTAISFQEVTSRVQQSGSGLIDWKVKRAGAEGGRGQDCIQKTFLFNDFHQAWKFMERCVPYINVADHHPEWFNVYNRVEVTLTTHDAKGISEKDFNLAKEMERVCKEVKN